MEINLNEMQLIRHSLDSVTISGKDAIMMANLQVKLENEIASLQASLEPPTPDKKPRK
jgi:hypothetical protein